MSFGGVALGSVKGDIDNIAVASGIVGFGKCTGVEVLGTVVVGDDIFATDTMAANVDASDYSVDEREVGAGGRPDQVESFLSVIGSSVVYLADKGHAARRGRHRSRKA